MKKILLTFFMFLATLTTSQNTYADFGMARDGNSPMVIGGYNNYAPFGYTIKGVYQTVFFPILNGVTRAFPKNQFSFRLYKMNEGETIAREMRTGEVDIFIGAYNQTKEFENLHLLFPAVVSNPVSFFLLPSTVSSIKTVEDIKKLKGIRYSEEVFTDFIEEKLKTFNLEQADKPYDMFEKLFTHKVDYIIGGYYFVMIEAIKLGVNRQIAASKQALWNIPIFIGIGQMSPNRDAFAKYISGYFQDEKHKEEIKNNCLHLLELFEKEYSGVVPPTFGLDKEETTEASQTEASTDTVVTPADNEATQEAVAPVSGTTKDSDSTIEQPSDSDTAN